MLDACSRNVSAAYLRGDCTGGVRPSRKAAVERLPIFIFVTYIGDCLELLFFGIQIGIQISSAFHIIMIENGLEKAIKTHRSTC